MLWHKRLDHISRQKIGRLVKDGIFYDLAFSDFDTCVDRIKGKMATKVGKTKNDRCTDVWDLIYIDNCGSFTLPSMGGFKYFIHFY